MPKVAEAHRRAQEQRFVDAARRCFTRYGVDGTSMEQIRTEAGVSAGLMYRYFASKDDMIRAAIAGSLTQFEILIDAVGQRPEAATGAGYLTLLLDALRQFRCHSEGVDLFVLAIQGWAHAQSRPDAKAVITDSFARQLDLYRIAARVWGTPADSMARAVAAAVIGYVVQSVFTASELDIADYVSGLAALAQ